MKSVGTARRTAGGFHNDVAGGHLEDFRNVRNPRPPNHAVLRQKVQLFCIPTCWRPGTETYEAGSLAAFMLRNDHERRQKFRTVCAFNRRRPFQIEGPSDQLGCWGSDREADAHARCGEWIMLASEGQHALAAADPTMNPPLVNTTVTWPVSARDGVLKPATPASKATRATFVPTSSWLFSSEETQ
jgi:hypothetical protein